MEKKDLFTFSCIIFSYYYSCYFYLLFLHYEKLNNVLKPIAQPGYIFNCNDVNI